jgi:hypothetical protein
MAGSTLVIDESSCRTIQSFPSRRKAKEHVKRVLRLRQDEGYEIQEASELADEEAARIADPIARLVKHHPERGRACLDFEEGPVSPAECLEIVARLATAAPSSIDYIRNREVPGGLFGAALAGKALPSVKALVSTTLFDRAPWECPKVLDDLADVVAALPNLERAFAEGEFMLREANHGCLRELYLRGDPLSPGTVAALGGGSLPVLSTLGLSLGEEHGLDGSVAAALRSLAAPCLCAVHIAKLTNVTRFLVELTERTLPAWWATLLLDGSVGDEDELLAVLRERASALRSLVTLGLPLADDLSEGGVAEAKALLPSVVEISDFPDVFTPEATDDW